MINQIKETLIYLLNLTFNEEVLWIVYPLALATIITLVYFERHHEESPGWNTHVANSLVLIFIASMAFKHFFSIDTGGIENIVNFPIKFITCITTLLLGFIILLFNFEHILPEKISRKISSPLTLNIFGYTIILFLYSEIPLNLSLVISLTIIFLSLILILNLIRIGFKKMFIKLSKMKEKEKIEEVKEVKKEIVNEKKNLESKERKIKKAELKEIKKQKKELKKIEKISKKI